MPSVILVAVAVASLVLAGGVIDQRLRDACDDCGALLVFDEVITGFRVGVGGATARSGVPGVPGAGAEASRRVGFVGLGIMGSAMAGNLIRAGFTEPLIAFAVLRQVQVMTQTATLARLDYGTADPARAAIASPTRCC